MEVRERDGLAAEPESRIRTALESRFVESDEAVVEERPRDMTCTRKWLRDSTCIHAARAHWASSKLDAISSSSTISSPRCWSLAA
jgi:hypothetical protein